MVSALEPSVLYASPRPLPHTVLFFESRGPWRHPIIQLYNWSLLLVLGSFIWVHLLCVLHCFWLQRLPFSILKNFPSCLQLTVLFALGVFLLSFLWGSLSSLFSYDLEEGRAGCSMYSVFLGDFFFPLSNSFEVFPWMKNLERLPVDNYRWWWWRIA